MPWVLVTLLTGTTLMAASRTRAIRDAYAQDRLSRRSLQRGDFVPAFELRTTADTPAIVGAIRGDSLQLLVLLTSTCPYCERSEAAWREIAEGVAARRWPVRLLALTTDSAAQAARHAIEADLGFPLASILEVRQAALLRAYTVPQTVLVRGDGRVLHVRLGELPRGLAVDSILNAIGDVVARARVP